MTAGEFEAYALRYASRPLNMAADTFYRFQIYGEPNEPYPMDYFIWLVRNENSTILIDCGFNDERGAGRGRTWDTPPSTLLERMGVHPHDVDTVVLTHLHFDHVGNLDLFPNARFVMSQPEFDYWTGPFEDRPALNWPAERYEVEQVKQLFAEGRLHLVDGESELIPGLKLICVPGHTPGQLVTEVRTATGPVALLSDAAHYYDELDLDRPFYIHESIVGILTSYQQLRQMGESGRILVAGHDPLVTQRFTEVAGNCFDLASPVI